MALGCGRADGVAPLLGNDDGAGGAAGLLLPALLTVPLLTVPLPTVPLLTVPLSTGPLSAAPLPALLVPPLLVVSPLRPLVGAEGTDGAGAVGTAAAALDAAGGGCGARRAGLAGPSPANFSFRRRSTGASTVEEADLTNSPMSFSVLRTVLLSTPSSFASS